MRTFKRFLLLVCLFGFIRAETVFSMLQWWNVAKAATAAASNFVGTETRKFSTDAHFRGLAEKTDGNPLPSSREPFFEAHAKFERLTPTHSRYLAPSLQISLFLSYTFYFTLSYSLFSPLPFFLTRTFSICTSRYFSPNHFSVFLSKALSHSLVWTCYSLSLSVFNMLNLFLSLSVT